jgi:hypothetical protein
MSGLLAYLVERSARHGAVSASAADAEADRAAADAAPSAAEFRSQAGSVRPRPRSRYERRPSVESPDGAPLASGDGAEQPVLSASAPSPAEDAAGLPGQRRRIAPRSADSPDRRSPPPRATTAHEPAQPGIERGEERATPPAAPAHDGVAAARPASAPDSGSAPVAQRGAQARAAHGDEPPPVRRPVPVEPAEIRSRRQPTASVPAPVPPPAPSAAVLHVHPPAVPPAARAATAPRAGERAAVLQVSPSREPSHPAAGRLPQRSSAGTPIAPRVQVSIGRVEVRATFAPAPVPAAPPPRTGPPMSLDDYLKQRDGSARDGSA